RLVDPGVGEDIAFVFAVWFAAQRFAGFDKIIEPALAGGEIGAFALGDAVGYPVHDDGLGAIVPELAVDAIVFGIDDVEPFGRRWVDDLHPHLAAGMQLALPG